MTVRCNLLIVDFEHDESNLMMSLFHSQRESKMREHNVRIEMAN